MNEYDTNRIYDTVKNIGYVKTNRPFDLKWIVLDNTKVKKVFNWQLKFTKHDIFQDINLNDNQKR